jgi:hypothetical protein
MDLETSQLLRRLTELTEENNKILHKIQKHTRWTMFFGIVKWVIIIGITVGSYFAILPYINQMMDMYNSFESTQAQSNGLIEYLKNFQNSVKY